MDGPLLAGRYRRGARLGAGGMASVWGARDERTGRDVAVKVLHPHLAGDERQRARLRHEASALASIDDAHVVPVLDLIEDGEAPAIVMPRIDGETLADRLARDAVLSEPAALDIAVAIAEALAAAHAVGVVHRDMKPSNILLGTDGVVRLMDFGIAADLDATTELTVDGVVGTLRYLAPERLLGEPATFATDVWGLGVVLVEMLTGHPAYPGSTLAERLEAATEAVERPATVSAPTWEVIRRAADGDPTRRYPDGAALLDALRSVRDPEPVPAVVDPEAATAVIVVPVATPDPAPAGPAVEAAPVAPAAVQRAARRRRSPAAIGAGLAVLLLGAAGMAVVALDPGAAATPPSDAPAAVPVSVTPSPAPSVSASPAPTDAAPAAADGNDNDKGKGNGKGKGHGKDKP